MPGTSGSFRLVQSLFRISIFNRYSKLFRSLDDPSLGVFVLATVYRPPGIIFLPFFNIYIYISYLLLFFSHYSHWRTNLNEDNHQNIVDILEKKEILVL